MKVFGYSHKTKDELLELYECTVSADPQQLRELASFFESCAAAIEKSGKDWNHEHFISSQESINKTGPSIVVFNSDAE
ncbi:hypothetical protein ACJJI4_04325 [Microbulbifer sp. TRSA002]|uniref:hypothetical protein n=1 Tax=Microbulbifer sp. TRSA002 TaxID=3243382 RepID=UPI004039E203